VTRQTLNESDSTLTVPAALTCCEPLGSSHPDETVGLSPCRQQVPIECADSWYKLKRVISLECACDAVMTPGSSMPARRMETATPRKLNGMTVVSLRQANAKLGGVTGGNRSFLPAGPNWLG